MRQLRVSIKESQPKPSRRLSHWDSANSTQVLIYGSLTFKYRTLPFPFPIKNIHFLSFLSYIFKTLLWASALFHNFITQWLISDFFLPPILFVEKMFWENRLQQNCLLKMSILSETIICPLTKTRFASSVMKNRIFLFWAKMTWYIKLEACVRFFYQIFISPQMIVLQKLWKMFFISSKKLFLFSRYSHFCISIFLSLSSCQSLL